MRRFHSLLACIALATAGGCQQAATVAPGGPDGPSAGAPAIGKLAVEGTRKAGDRVEIAREGDAARIDILCPSGIGDATIVCRDGRWPGVLTVRLKYDREHTFRYLEHFSCVVWEDDEKAATDIAARIVDEEAARVVTIRLGAGLRARRMKFTWIDAYR